MNRLWQGLASRAPLRWRGVMLLLLLVPGVFLFTVTTPDDICRRTIHLGVARFALICDSSQAVKAERDLPGYITTPNIFRVYPVYIFLGAGFVSVLSPVAVGLRYAVVQGRISGNFDVGKFLATFIDSFGLTAVNFFFLGIALVMATALAGGPTPLGVALGLAIVTSDLVHAFVWSQHATFANILVPPGTILSFVLGGRLRLESPRLTLLWGLATATAILTFAFTAIWVPALMLGWLWCHRGRPRRREFAAFFAYLAAAGLPVLGWYCLFRFGLHQPFSVEADTFRQFVWLADAWQDGDLVAKLVQHFHFLASALPGFLGWPAPVALIGIAVFLWLGRTALSPADLLRDPVIIGAVVCCLGMVAFHYLQGFYVARLMVTLSFALFIALARLAWLSGEQRAGALFLGAIALAQIAYAFVAPPIAT